MKTHVFRLRRGSDLLKALQEYARTRRIAAGTVVSGVGCVTRARVRDASGVTVRELDGVRFGAERDGETGYDELAILSLEERA